MDVGIQEKRRRKIEGKVGFNRGKEERGGMQERAKKRGRW